MAKSALEKMMKGLGLSLLLEWQAIIKRKHQAYNFHSYNLLRHSFQLWREGAISQIELKEDELAKQV